ncbi:hypothetical protein FRB99_000482 [Tulasnella sp. 403]|nr:hypothetical protein FRB99_000482 [Tulasnella sp. 403]
MATSLTAYTDARAALIAEERSLRLDHQPQYLETLGPAEVVRKADEILRKFRKMEAVSMWCVETEQIPNIFPGMEFLTAKEVIQATELFRWVKKLPKGALLHAHMDAMCDARFLLDRALEQPQMHVRAQSVITSESIRSMLPEFSALPLNYQETSPHNLTDPLYKAESWVPLQVARQTFPAELGGIEGFDKWVLGTLRIDPNEAYVQYNTSKKVGAMGFIPRAVINGNTVQQIWKKFQSTFGVAAGLIGFEPILRAYFRELLLSSVEDGVSYVEARIMFFDKFMVRANGERNFSHREWVKMFSEVIEEVRQELASQGRDDEFVGAKVIYTTLRFITPDELDWYFEDCIALKKEFPHIIAGFDLVGHEDVGIPLLTYLPKLLEFQENVKSQGLYIPFIFHAGETLGDGDVVDDNLYDAVLLGTKRIGHGYAAKEGSPLKYAQSQTKSYA